MKRIGLIASVFVICLPGALLAQETGGAPGVLRAPRGHLQPRPSAPPDMQNNGGAAVSAKDDPAALDKELEPSTDRAIHSLCSYCLKPEHTKQR